MPTPGARRPDYPDVTLRPRTWWLLASRRDREHRLRGAPTHLTRLPIGRDRAAVLHAPPHHPWSVYFDRTAVLYTLDPHTMQAVTTYPDRATCPCDIPQGDNPTYRAIAQWAGYPDYRLYAVHHDLTHAWLGELLGRPSPALYADAHGLPHPPPEQSHEELLVNALQRMHSPTPTPLTQQERTALSQLPQYALTHLPLLWAALPPLPQANPGAATHAP